MLMLKFIGWIVGIALFCWATVSAFSIFSELKFLVDGWTWSVDQVPISIKTVALAIGKYVSSVVGGYREFVHGLVQMLHLPRLPQFVYDVAGVIAFSVGRGRWIERKARAAAYKEFGFDMAATYERYPLQLRVVALRSWLYNRFIPGGEQAFLGYPRRSRFLILAAQCIIYGGLVATVLAALFAIDFLYRHFSA
jgi:hypothetical protein